MKKYTLFSFMFVLYLILISFSAKSVSAANCAPGELFSSVTGQACGATTISTSCAPGDLFSITTGQSCNGTTVSPNNSGDLSRFNNLFNSFTSNKTSDNTKTLQQFLKDQGYYFGKVDGKYGKISARAVSDFQSDNDEITNPITTPPGFSTPKPCPFGTTPIGMTQSMPGSYICRPIPIPSTPVACTMEAKLCPDGKTYVSRSGPNCEFSICPTTSTSVVNPAFGYSETHLQDLLKKSPSISGVSGPKSLNINQQGTWSVTVSDLSGGNLSYSVIWGDEFNKSYTSLSDYNKYITDNSQQSSIFTHSYSQAGTYQPIFTATNSNGNAQTSLSVNVGNVPVQANSIQVLSPNGGESYKIGDSLNFKWASRGFERVIINLDNIDTGVRRGTFDAINGLDATTGSASWVIGNTIAPGNYKVFMTGENTDNNLVGYASSNNYFTITSTASTTQPPVVSSSPVTIFPTLNIATSTASQIVPVGINGASNLTKVSYMFTSTSSMLNITELKFSVTSPNTVASISVGGVSAPVVNGVAWLTGLNVHDAYVPSGGSFNQDVFISYPPVGANGLLSGSNSHIALEYIKYTNGGTTGTQCTAAFGPCTQNLTAVSSPVMTLVGTSTASAYPLGCPSISGYSSINGNPCNISTTITPVVTVTANPSSVLLGQPSAVAWSSTGNNLSCNLSGGLVGASGNQVVYPTSTTNYSVTCTNSSGVSGTGSVTVNVTTPTYRPGCSSTSGYSSVDGTSCAFPAGCSSNQGYSSIDGTFCAI